MPYCRLQAALRPEPGELPSTEPEIPSLVVDEARFVLIKLFEERFLEPNGGKDEAIKESS